MKVLMIIVDESKKEELEVFLSHSGVEGYTELSPTAGMGSTGLRLGSRAFPRTSAVVFTVLSPEAFASLTNGLDELCAAWDEKLKLISWDVEVVR